MAKKTMDYNEFVAEMKKEDGVNLIGYIVFQQKRFEELGYGKLPVKSRTYKVEKADKRNKLFKAGSTKNNLVGDCLDGQDDNVRLDFYIYEEDASKEWLIEKCYVEVAK